MSIKKLWNAFIKAWQVMGDWVSYYLIQTSVYSLKKRTEVNRPKNVCSFNCKNQVNPFSLSQVKHTISCYNFLFNNWFICSSSTWITGQIHNLFRWSSITSFPSSLIEYGEWDLLQFSILIHSLLKVCVINHKREKFHRSSPCNVMVFLFVIFGPFKLMLSWGSLVPFHKE